jgi:hypothetical protein
MQENIKVTIVTPTIRPNGLDVVARSIKKQTMCNEIEWCYEINTTGVVDFSKAMNKMIRRAKGELIVSVQDYIKLPDDAIEKLWNAYLKEPDVFWTCPVGKTKDWEHITWDWRIDADDINWQEWEIDFGAASKKALFDIGGFEEELDEYWGFDNCIPAKRAELKGYTFKCLKDNKAVAYDHNAFEEHPFMSLRNEMAYNAILQKTIMGDYVDYLK